MEKMKKICPRKTPLMLDLQLAQQCQQQPYKHLQNDTIIEKPLRSTKNQFQIKRELFRSNKLDTSLPRKYSLALDKLQKEKEELIESIYILKTSAICAIAEKEDHLQRLKNSTQSQKNQKFEDIDRCSNRNLSVQKELQLTNQQLCCQLNRERLEMGVHLEQKEYKIEEQELLIQKMRNYIGYLQQNQRLANDQIKQLSQKIGYLTAQIQSAALTVAVDQYKTNPDYKQIKIPTSVSSSPYYNRSAADLHTLNYLEQMIQNGSIIQIEEKYKEKICKIQENHKNEITQLKEFYDNKIKNIRELYDAYIHDQHPSLICSNHKKIAYHSHQPQPSTPSQKIINRTQSTKEYRIHHKKIIQFQCPQKISESSVHNLKEQIGHTPQYLSYISNEEQNQFTKKYFQNPFLFQKQKSSKSVDSYTEPQESQEIINKKQSEKIQNKLQKDLNQSKGQIPNDRSMLFWEKASLFATGLISGISLTSLVTFALKKKKILSIGLPKI